MVVPKIGLCAIAQTSSLLKTTAVFSRALLSVTEGIHKESLRILAKTEVHKRSV
jgi:hypothetical protein